MPGHDDLVVRPATHGDGAAVARIAREVVDEGTTYAFAADTPDERLRAFFMDAPYTAVAELRGDVVGVYMVRPNQPGRGSHVANAAYAVSGAARGQGVGRRLAVHSLEQARRLGFTAMQFNIVVATNQSAVALWKAVGFAIVGTLPKAFDHPKLGLVDAYVMHRFL